MPDSAPESNERRTKPMKETPEEGPGHKSWLEKLSVSLNLTGEPKDREDVLTMLREAHHRHIFDADALDMMQGVLRVADMQVRDVMIPRGQMQIVDQNWSLERLLTEVVASGHSRFPVINDTRDNVVGILIVKDLLRPFSKGNAVFKLNELLRPAYFIPESKRLNVLLREFRSTHLHMAIVVDEYGGVAGLVTIEDVLEQIVGDIDDEHDTDEEDHFIRPRGDKRFMIKALTPIEEFNAYFNTHLSEERADTIGGFVMMETGHLPKRGEVIEISNLRFRVLRADKRRLYLLELTLLETPDATE